MNEHTLRILEFSLILKEVQAYTWGEDGRRRIESEPFFTDREELERFRKLVEEFRNCTTGNRIYPPSPSLTSRKSCGWPRNLDPSWKERRSPRSFDTCNPLES